MILDLCTVKFISPLKQTNKQIDKGNLPKAEADPLEAGHKPTQRSLQPEAAHTHKHTSDKQSK